MITICYAHASDKKRKRNHNEDSYLADLGIGLFVIADGMGGYEAGATASAIVVQSVLKDVSNGMALEKALSTPHHRVLQSVEKGIGRPGYGRHGCGAENRRIRLPHRLGRRQPCISMGPQSGHRQPETAHSRPFFCSENDGLRRYFRNEARLHPQRNILTQVLGAADLTDVAAGTILGKICHGQKILLCSDGLTTELADEAISAIMAWQLPDQACAEALISAANDREGKDNITVILVFSLAKNCTADD